MVLLFRRFYELRAEEAAAGERVVVVGPRFRCLINRWLLTLRFL
jgi:hypothetical protein